MRWKVGNTNYASGDLTLFGSDISICVYENETDLCDAGHKLLASGICTSQSVGTYNSTDDSFQPTYSICTSDYLGSVNNYGFIVNKSDTVNSTYKVISFGGISSYSKEILRSYLFSFDTLVHLKSLSKTPFDFSLYIGSNSISVAFSEIFRAENIIGTHKIIQHDSGFIARAYNAFSDYFPQDIFGYVPILHPYYFVPKKESTFKIVASDDPSGAFSEIVDDFKSNTTNPSSVSESNPDSICVGDLVAPSLENISPGQSTHLNDVSDNVSFDVVDTLGGVKKSSIYITVSGNLTAQAGGYSIIEAGVAQVGSASFTGTDSRYSFLYNPPSDWQNNEIVKVTITGTDNVPDDDEGNPFSCYGSDPNSFYQEWTYQIENHGDFSATVTAVADTGAPYLEDISPAPYFGYNDAFGDISFHIKDDLAGVDLSSIFVYINNVAVVRYGTATTSAVAITGTSNDYLFYYTNSAGFSYGSRVEIRVVADDLYSISPNTLDYTYYYDIIDYTTLSIENFYPEVGITWNPELTTIQVDVIDSVYDVDDSDLYLSINGNSCSASVLDLYDNRELTTTVSGLTSISGTWVNSASASGVYLSGISISGDFFSGGTLSDGLCYDGQMGSFPDPFSLTTSGEIISAYMYEGSAVSGTIDTTLVSGVNWDGKVSDSTVTDVDISSFYASSVSSSGTVISGTVGRRLSYHPPNDFIYGIPINVLVHGANLNSLAPVIREQVYQLGYGCSVKAYDQEFNHHSRVNVFVGASNLGDLPNDLSYGFYFTTIAQPEDNLSASITGIAPWVDISANINPQAPVHKYGKNMVCVIYAQDIEGNELGPYTFSYTIEQAPE